jgi:nucleoside-diphosphate-sugar epimerase
MKIFVTGATGFIGGRLARELVGAGHQVRALVRDPAKARALEQAGVELCPGDIRDRESVRRAMHGSDALYHVAAWYRVGSPDVAEAREINVDGTRNVLETMRQLGIPKGVYTSSIAIFSDTHGHTVDEDTVFRGPYNSVYEQTKAAAHYDVALPMMAEGLPLVVVMPGVVYGPGDHSPIRDSFVMFLQRKLPVLPRGTVYCWGHVDDTVRAHLLAMERGRVGEAYITAGPICEFARVFEIAAAKTSIPAPRMRLGGDTLRRLAKVTGAIERMVPWLPASYRAESLRSVAGTTSIASSAKAERELQWQARGLEVGLVETLEYEMRALGLSPN